MSSKQPILAVGADGKEINPYIPQFISKAPWYVADKEQGLQHQRVGGKDTTSLQFNEWYKRGAKAGPAATKFRKGACANCGAMTHAQKDCTDRPRKVSAKFSGRDIQADEVVQDLKFDWDSKRDRWAGYDPASQLRLVKEHDAAEIERRKLKQSELLQQATGEAADKAIDDETEEFEAVDQDKEMPSASTEATLMTSTADSKTRTVVRNLRIREDTAKYLRNLDPESAYYDPKTRSMRDNPTPSAKGDDASYVGDNFVRYSGQVTEVYDMQIAALQAAERGENMHLEAAPTEALLMRKQMLERKAALQAEQREKLLSTYGGQEHIAQETAALQQTESYVEFGRDGRIIRGAEKAAHKSKYPEDVFHNGHTAVWGSYWHDGAWGYACCKQTLRHAYCTGEAGREAVESAQRDMEERTKLAQDRQAAKPLAASGSNRRKFVPEHEERARDTLAAFGDKRAAEATPEEIEDYLRKKPRSDDPMTSAAFTGGR